jgi:hypothetical protein
MKGIDKVRKKIKNRYIFHEAVKEVIRSESDDDEKVRLIQYLAHHNANCNMGKYSDEELEFELVKIGQKISFVPECEPEKGTVLHVATMVYAIGGHTSFINNWSLFDSKRKYSVLLTDERKTFCPPFLKETIESSGGTFHQLKSITIYEKVNELLKIAQHYEKIILHIHTFDTVPIIAFSNRNWKIPVYFLNQANYRFSLGMSITDCFIGMFHYDSLKGKLYRGADKVVTLPIPTKTLDKHEKFIGTEYNKTKVKECYAYKYKFPYDAKIVISIGASFKFKKIIGYDFADFAEGIIRKSDENVYVFIIGAKGEDNKKWERLRRRTHNHVQVLPTISRKELKKWMLIADVFVTSFPMNSSGKDEALESGVPCFSLQVTQRGLEAEDHNHCKSIAELTRRVCSVLDGSEHYTSETTYFKKMMMSPEIWSEYVNRILDMPLEHKIHDFKSKVIVSKEEIINFQLLEKKEKMEWYPTWEHLSIKNQRKLCFLSALTKVKLLIN